MLYVYKILITFRIDSAILSICHDAMVNAGDIRTMLTCVSLT